MPLYLAYLGMGAVSPDKVGLKFSEKDGLNYRIAIAKRNAARQARTLE